GRYNMMVITTFFSAILVLALWLPSKGNAPAIVFSALYGFGSGAFVSLAPALVAQISDLREVGVRNGTFFAVISFAALTGTPIGGALVPDVLHGSYTRLQIFCGVVMIVGSTLFVFARGAVGGFKLTKSSRQNKLYPNMNSILSGLYDLSQAVRGVNSTFLTDQHVPGTNLTDKWIIVSGSNNGVGFEAAKSFASWGANLILACREPPTWEQHPTAAVNECKDLAAAHGHSSIIEWWQIDMADLSSVDDFCQRWLQCDRALHILCNNAGIAESTMQTRITKDGFQLVHQVNFLSHVLLTLRLLPSLARSVEPRIICTTSCYHHLGVFDLDRVSGKLSWKGNDYQNNKLYLQMWVAEMQSRLLKHPEYLHITVNGVHPGFVASGIWDGLEDAGKAPGGLSLLLRYVAITSQQGGLAIAHAATSLEFGPDPKKQGVGAGNGRGGGKYINRIWEAPAKSYCNDPEARSRLWIKLNEELGLQEKGLLTVLGL
ncbi:unnamed protein product, partial [Penicillium nalgiovense]